LVPELHDVERVSPGTSPYHCRDFAGKVKESKDYRTQRPGPYAGGRTQPYLESYRTQCRRRLEL